MSVYQKVKQAVMLRSRNRKLDDFYSLCPPTASVLDVGVTGNEINNATNLFLKNFRFSDEQYTGLAVQPMEGMRKKHPGKRFVEYPGGVFPFADGEFDWVFSNAVIEHVGNRADQLLFLNEMLRVGKNVFFTTPNKWFPIESHTNVFFRHWFDASFYEWCRRNNRHWTVDNLLLLGAGDLANVLKQSNADHYRVRKNRTLGWPMTFTVVCSREKGS